MKYKAYPKYKDSGVDWLGDIPVEWQVRRLKYLANKSDKKIAADENQPLPYIGLEHVESWIGNLLPLDPDLIPTGICNRFGPGDTLFGKLRPYLAKACNVDFNGLCSSELLVLSAQRLNRHFLLYSLLCKGFISLIDSSTYGAKMPRANWEFIGSCSLPLPSLNEQHAVSSFLDRETNKIDTLLAKKRTLVEKLKEKRTALISRTVTRGLPPDAARAAGLDPHPKLKPSGVEWLGDVPEGWDLKRVKHVARVQIGITYSPDDVVDEGEGVFVLRASNIQNGKLSFNDNVYVKKEIKDSDRVKEGDILICSRNGSAHLVGKCAYITAEHARKTFGAFMSIVRSDYGLYLYQFFNSDIFKAQSGLFSTSTINQLTTSTLENMVVAFPPKGEQSAIATYLESETTKIDQLIAKVEAAIDRLQEYRTALITAAVTGKIDVRGEADGVHGRTRTTDSHGQARTDRE